jgi:biotin transport system substrate-specific component
LPAHPCFTADWPDRPFWPAPPAATAKRRAGLRQLSLLVAGALLAETSIYAVGLPWLAILYTGGDLARAAAVGAVPYLLGDLLKAAVAIGAIRAGTRYGSRGGNGRGTT